MRSSQASENSTSPLASAPVSDNLPLVQTYEGTGERALEALGDPTRRAVFESLLVTPKAVGELAEALPVSRPAVSQHLKVLREAGLVDVRSEGTRRVYRVLPDGVATIREYLDDMWGRALTAFAAAVEQEPETGRGQES